MSGSEPPRVLESGELAASPPTQVLKTLESRDATARVHFETELGRGEVDVVQGKIVDAVLGDLFGRQAMLALFGVTDGRFTISELVNGEPRPPICASVDQLLADRAHRIAEWRRLSEQMPPLSTSLRLSPQGESSLSKRGLSGPERRLFPLLDGRRSIADLVDQSSLDAVDAFGILLGWLREGFLLELPAPELRHDGFEVVRPSPRQSVPPTPAGETPVPPLGSGPSAPMGAVPFAYSPGGSRRRTTVVGMGIPAPEPVRPRRAEVHRTISVGTPSAPTVSAAAGPMAPMPTPSGGTHAPMIPLAPAVPNIAADPGAHAAHVGGGVPRSVGRYEVLGPIGHGGMGTVYLCRLTSETGFRRFFALKLLRQHLLADPAAAKRFLEEARLAGQLHHPNVVSVIDAGIDGPQPFLVMDYVEGGSLRQLIAAHPIAQPAELIVPIVLDALAGLHAVHQLVSDDGVPLNVVHCDVSPENLLVGVDGICRLTDFGVARRESTIGERLGHGKPAYLAPEQVLRRPIDRRVDIFTVGVVLYNCLTGGKLFDSPSVDETLRRVAGEPIAPPSTVGLRPPPCFDFICMKALERDPNRRYSTAEEMAAELRRVALRENLIAPTSSVAAWVRACVGRELDQRRAITLHPPAAGVAGSIAPAVGAGPADAEPRDLLRGGPSAGDPTGTVPLDLGGKTQRRVLLAAAVLAAGAVLVTLLWPSGVSRFFRINTTGARSDVALLLDPVSSAVSSAASAPASSAALSDQPASPPPSGKSPPPARP